MTRFSAIFSKPVRLAAAVQLIAVLLSAVQLSTARLAVLLMAALLMALLITKTSLADTQTGEQNVNPTINKPMLDPDYQVWVQRFEHAGREVYQQRESILKAVNIQPGMAIADIGAGTGLFTRLFAPAVGPQGRVYAVDIARNFIDEILRQANDAGFNNVIGIVNSQRDTGLEPGSIDIAFVCATYHHFEYPRSMLQSIHKALRPGGSLIVIDFRKIKGLSSDWVMSHTRAKKATVIGEIESQDFTLNEDLGFLKANYYLRFTRSRGKAG